MPQEDVEDGPKRVLIKEGISVILSGEDFMKIAQIEGKVAVIAKSRVLLLDHANLNQETLQGGAYVNFGAEAEVSTLTIVNTTEPGKFYTKTNLLNSGD